MIEPRNVPPNPTHDSLDRLLDAHLDAAEDLVPSSGFAASVMDAIQAQAIEPPPIAFPWRRVLPGAIAALCALVALVIFASHKTTALPKATMPAAHVSGIPWAQFTHTLASTPTTLTLFWTVLAACLSVAAVAASFRLTGRGE